jgi:hypothetical protein
MAAMYEQRKQLKQVSGNVQQGPDPVKHLFRTVPRSKRVHNWVERTAAGVVIDTVSAGLSLLTVVTYMVSCNELELHVGSVLRAKHLHHIQLDAEQG